MNTQPGPVHISGSPHLIIRMSNLNTAFIGAAIGTAHLLQPSQIPWDGISYVRALPMDPHTPHGTPPSHTPWDPSSRIPTTRRRVTRARARRWRWRWRRRSRAARGARAKRSTRASTACASRHGEAARTLLVRGVGGGSTLVMMNKLYGRGDADPS